MWLQSDGKQQDSYLQVRDELMGGLRQRGDVLVVGGSIHQSFTDDEFYFSATGRRLLGDGVGPEAANDITWETPDAISLRTAQLTEVRIPRKDIEELSPATVSLMPDGLERTLNRQELRDLVEFLVQRK